MKPVDLLDTAAAIADFQREIVLILEGLNHDNPSVPWEDYYNVVEELNLALLQAHSSYRGVISLIQGEDGITLRSTYEEEEAAIILSSASDQLVPPAPNSEDLH